MIYNTVKRSEHGTFSNLPASGKNLAMQFGFALMLVFARTFLSKSLPGKIIRLLLVVLKLL